MNYEETVNFIKLFLLLMNGGTFILRTLIHKLIIESGKSLDDLLLQSRELFEEKLKKNRKQFDLLFPGSSKNADIEQWDISLLTCVLQNMFKGLLDSRETDAIKVIRDHRNKILAHNAKSEMTLRDFMSAWNQVSVALTDLSTNTAAPEDQKELKDIESSIFKDPFQKEIVGQLKEIGQTDTLVHAVIEKFMPLVKDRIDECEKKSQKEIEKYIERLEDLEKEQKRQGETIALLVRMKVNTGRSRSRRKVEEHLLEASRDIISTDGSDADSSDDETLAAVRNLFGGMEKQGVKIVKADKGSILFTILCPTIKSLIDLTHYLKSPEIQPKLWYIETTVNKCHNCVANIAIDVDLNSLHLAVKELETVLDYGTVYLTLECDGVAGVRNAFHTFGHNESTNTILSEALSRKVGEQVDIKTDIDIDKMKGTIEKNNKENESREKERYLSKEISVEKHQEMQTLEKDSLKQEQTRNLFEEEVHTPLYVSGLQKGKQAIPKTYSRRPEKKFCKSGQQRKVQETDLFWIEESFAKIYHPLMASETDFLRQKELVDALLLQLKESEAEDPVLSWAKDREETIRDLRRLGKNIRYQGANANIIIAVAGVAAASFFLAPVTVCASLALGMVMTGFAAGSFHSLHHREMLYWECRESLHKDRKSFEKLKKAIEIAKQVLKSEEGKELPGEARLVEICVAFRFDVSEKTTASLLKLEQTARFASHAIALVALSLDIDCFIKDVMDLRRRNFSAAADKVFELADQLQKEYDEVIADTQGSHWPLENNSQIFFS